ncbi:hypothetical protein I302_104636 [Kwoniella bestiolae CBS 10118]|uniref:Uncharacterized protein n=1 Tax=Kwoniella bestiolae CBS 10118 TaxID=1296100 RepID=A0A1B9GBT4_9TREE|nr:hypothetical protein I302_03345 [Kwoniella bestiolae CBS 10118]OCF28486.1 hypothetical protein I302_03345 [Kwoniella bestiolae CBS 10118]
MAVNSILNNDADTVDDHINTTPASSNPGLSNGSPNQDVGRSSDRTPGDHGGNERHHDSNDRDHYTNSRAHDSNKRDHDSFIESSSSVSEVPPKRTAPIMMVTMYPLTCEGQSDAKVHRAASASTPATDVPPSRARYRTRQRIRDESDEYSAVNELAHCLIEKYGEAPLRSWENNKRQYLWTYLPHVYSEIRGDERILPGFYQVKYKLWGSGSTGNYRKALSDSQSGFRSWLNQADL